MPFAGTVTDTYQLVDLESLLDAIITIARDDIRQCARLIKRYARIPAVRGDELRLRQLFLKLIVSSANSTASIGERRALTLSTSLSGNRVVIEVADAAPSAERDAPQDAFEPLFSDSWVAHSFAKPQPELMLCHRIVASHGGEIKICTSRGHGATYQVTLPVAGPPSQEPGLSDIPKASRKDRARILIVDDEPLLGQTLTFAFSGRHDMVLATSGREALARLEENPAFDLVLCDLMMPDVSGTKVFEVVESAHPELVPRFAFMTGGAFTEKAQEFLERYRGRCIDKPFTISDVEHLLTTLAEPQLDS
jgi:CheY-like chemotaxis protein